MILVFLWESAIHRSLPTEIEQVPRPSLSLYFSSGESRSSISFPGSAEQQSPIPGRRPQGAAKIPPTPIYDAVHATAIPDNWAYMILYVLASIGTAYICGHLIAWLGASILGMALLDYGIGNPYQILLRLPAHADTTHNERTEFLGRVLCLNLCVMFIYGATYPNGPRSAFMALAAISLLLVFFGPRLARTFAWTRSNAGSLRNNLVSILEEPRDPIPTKLVEQFSEHFERRFTLQLKDAGSECYWLPRLSVQREAPELEKAIDYLHRLSSLSRNLSAAFYSAWVYCYISALVHSDALESVTHRVVVFGSPILFLVSSVILFSRFYHLHFSRETRMLVRSFVHVCASGR